MGQDLIRNLNLYNQTLEFNSASEQKQLPCCLLRTYQDLSQSRVAETSTYERNNMSHGQIIHTGSSPFVTVNDLEEACWLQILTVRQEYTTGFDCTELYNSIRTKAMKDSTEFSPPPPAPKTPWERRIQSTNRQCKESFTGQGSSPNVLRFLPAMLDISVGQRLFRLAFLQG